MHAINDKDVIRLLRSEVNQAGGQASWARREQIELTMLNKVLCGHRPPTKEIIRALRLCNVYALNQSGRKLGPLGANVRKQSG